MMRIVMISVFFVAVLSCASGRKRLPSTHEVYWSTLGMEKAEPITYPRFIPDSTSLRYPPRYHEVVLPVWIPDYVTPSGDLVQAHYIYVVVRPATWYLEGYPAGAEPVIPSRP